MYLKKKGNIFHTVTFRLTLWYTVLFAILALTVFFIMYITLTSNLSQRMDANLLNEAKEFGALYRTGGIEMLKVEFERETQSEGIDRMFCRLFSPSMETLASSDPGVWANLDLQQSKLEDFSNKAEAFKTLSVPGYEHKARVIYEKTYDGNIIEIGHTLRDDEELMEDYREIFGSAMALMLVCGGLLGWFVAKRAMIGVERVTQTAVNIGKGGLAYRVPLGNEGKEIENLATAFNDMLERIESLITELKEVTNNIAHDLRSPITRIRGVAETTLTGESGIDEYKEMAGIIVEESDRLVGMINAMLEIAKVDSGIVSFSKTDVDMLKIIKDAYGLFQPVAEDKGIHLEVDLPEEPLIILGDCARLQRVVANLLDNAIKYTPASGKVLLRAKTTQTNVVISVIDSGIGIGEEDLPHIFDRFYRVDQSRSTPGNGLGLSLAQAIVRAHVGEITAESHLGKGSTFTIIIPRTSFQN